MKTSLIAAFLAVTLLVPRASAGTPNIIMIMADDLGLGDVSHHVRTVEGREPVVETPAIDSLATDGMWFTDGHSSTALCSPTRYCVMSGNLNFRSYAPWGVWGTFRKNAIEPHQATLGTVARGAGYATAFVGKWHLGGDFINRETGEISRSQDHAKPDQTVDLTRMVGGGPPELGFDYSFTLPCGIQGPVYTAYENGKWYPLGEDSRIVYLDQETVVDPSFLSSKGPGMGDSNWDPRDMGKRLAAKAVDFIDAHAGQKPFFLCYWSPMVHLPHCPPDEFDGVQVKGATPTTHLDMIRDLDLQVARIVKALKRNGIYDNTLIVFTSDNGGLYVASSLKAGHNPNGGWRGSKNSAYEGGHRVPFIATWPAEISAGRVSDEPVATHDMLATMAALLKRDVPADEAMDSLNLLPLFTGEEGFVSRDSLVLQAGSRYEIMFRVGDWKLILQSDHRVTKFEPIALFNLAENPREQESRNLVNHPAHQERVQTMRRRYLEIRNAGQRTTPPLTFAHGGADKAGVKKKSER